MLSRENGFLLATPSIFKESDTLYIIQSQFRCQAVIYFQSMYLKVQLNYRAKS